jgi:hypothetical protein
MPQGFAYLSEGDPNFQGVLEFVMPRQLQAKRSMLRNGSGDNEEEEESVVPISGLGESKMPQEGHPLDLEMKLPERSFKPYHQESNPH